MSLGISAGTWGAVAAGFLAANLLQQKPNVPAPPAPGAPPQASKAPDAGGTLQGMQGAGQAGGAPGVAQTFLSGLGGVDPNKLLLGRNTLLGA